MIKSETKKCFKMHRPKNKSKTFLSICIRKKSKRKKTPLKTSNLEIGNGM